jgi:hypothetical protein
MWGGWNGMWGDFGKGVTDLVNKHEAEGQAYLDNYHNNDPSYTKNRAQLAVDHPRADPTANISRILGLDQVNTDPYPSHGYTTDGPPGRQGRDEDPGQPIDEYEVRAQKIRDLMADLEGAGAGTDNLAMVDQAFAGSLAAIDKARQSAQTNFNTSEDAINKLTAGHVHDIQTVDRKAVEDNANQLTGAYDKSYTDAKTALQGNQQREMSARAEMLSRLGIQEAGLGDTGKAQSDALTRLEEDQGAMKQQAAGYKAADLTRNTELASSQSAAGVERQGDLRRQLNGINANLDQSQASVENSKAAAKISAQNADKADYLKQLQFYQDQLKDIQDEKTRADDTAYSRAKDERDFNAKNSGTKGGALDVAAQNVMQTGEDPGQYADAYAQTMQENSYDSRSGKDKISDTVAKMTAKNKNLNPRTALRYVMSIENFGTDKGNTPIG